MSLNMLQFFFYINLEKCCTEKSSIKNQYKKKSVFEKQNHILKSILTNTHKNERNPIEIMLIG